MPVRTTPPSLLVRIRDHDDQQAWEFFTDVYAPLVYGYCRKNQLDANDAADVAQEVLLRVARGIRNFEYDRTKGRFRDWLSRIVHNEIARWAGKRKTAATVGAELELEHDGCRLWSRHFEEHILNAALKTSQQHFEPATWRAFELVWIEDRPSSEVAEQLDRPIDFVYTAKSRVLKRLSMEVYRLAEDALF